MISTLEYKLLVYLLINMQSSCHKYSSASRREVVEWPKEPNFLDKRVLLHHELGALASLSVPSHCTTFSSSSALRPSCWSRRWCSRTPRTPRRPPPARSHHRLPRDRHQSEPSCSPRQPWPACSLFPGQLASEPGCIFHRSFARREASTSGALSWLALGEDIRSNLCQDMSHRALQGEPLGFTFAGWFACHQLSCNGFVKFKDCQIALVWKIIGKSSIIIVVAFRVLSDSWRESRDITLNRWGFWEKEIFF